jgi:hypothetical protein
MLISAYVSAFNIIKETTGCKQRLSAWNYFAGNNFVFQFLIFASMVFLKKK